MEADNKKKLIQVEAKEHYTIEKYLTKGRWISFWHQVCEVNRLLPGNVLEIGGGAGIFSAVLRRQGIKCTVVDVDPELSPDCVGTVLRLPFSDRAFQIVACFEVLEHLPFECFAEALLELVRVSNKYVVLSLPDARRVWAYSIHIPKLQSVNFLVPRLQLRRPTTCVCPEHFWEINLRGYPVRKVRDVINEVGLRVNCSYRVFENPYHRFFVCAKREI